MWVYQHKDFGLGNFVNLTPAIWQLYLTRMHPVDCYFESDYVKSAYEDWEAINVIDEKPNSEPILSSSMINQTKPDWQYVWDMVIGECKPISTFVPHKKLAVFMNGCANPQKRDTKNPGNEIYEYIVSELTDYTTAFVGGVQDIMDVSFDFVVVGNMGAAISIIQKADIVITNDTGLYHVAGALKKKGFVMWKDTNFIKNMSMNPFFTYSMKGNWQKDFDKWIFTS